VNLEEDLTMEFQYNKRKYYKQFFYQSVILMNVRIQITMNVMIHNELSPSEFNIQNIIFESQTANNYWGGLYIYNYFL